MDVSEAWGCFLPLIIRQLLQLCSGFRANGFFYIYFCRDKKIVLLFVELEMKKVKEKRRWCGLFCHLFLARRFQLKSLLDKPWRNFFSKFDVLLQKNNNGGISKKNRKDLLRVEESFQNSFHLDFSLTLKDYLMFVNLQSYLCFQFFFSDSFSVHPWRSHIPLGNQSRTSRNVRIHQYLIEIFSLERFPIEMHFSSFFHWKDSRQDYCVELFQHSSAFSFKADGIWKQE